MEQANPEAQHQQITARVLFSGSLNKLEEVQTIEVPTTSEIRKHFDIPFFKTLLKEVNKDVPETEDYVWIDARDIADLITEETAETLVRLITKFSPKPVELSKTFKSWKEFTSFKPILDKFELHKSFADLAKLETSVGNRFPVLLLIDVGGSILYRASEKLSVAKMTSAQYCQIKMHHHYYRPGFQTFLARLITHPRVKLGFYTSIMRKNVMPLLFKIFDLPALAEHRTEIFEIFDQSYNMDDARPGRKPYATKRSLERVFDHEKVKNFNFTKENTLMIDSEVIKILDYPDNSITVKPYEVEDVLNASTG